jgi:lipooligosaccharide transport system ATP-binding protein
VTDGLLVEARGLTKVYPPRGSSSEFRAVDAIDFELRRGEAFGFLGPNGAGKSSTMRMVSAVSPITAGTLRVLDMDPAYDGPRIRARIGVVPQDDCLDRDLTVRENLYIYGRYFGLSKPVIRERLARLLEFAQLQDRADEQVEALSGGMRRRLTIARSLINEPEILLLDEPTTGLDAESAAQVVEPLRRLADGRTTIVISHDLALARQATQILVVEAGRIVESGTHAELVSHEGLYRWLDELPSGEREPGPAVPDREPMAPA